MITSMFLCFFATYAATAFNHTIKEAYKIQFYDNYTVVADHGEWVTLFKTPTFLYQGIPDSLIKKLKDTGETSNVSYIKRLNSVIQSSSKNDTLHDYYGKSIHESYGKPDESYIKMIDDYNLDLNKEYYYTNILEVDDTLLLKLLNVAKKHDNETIETLKDGKHVIINCTDIEKCPYQIGDKVDILQIIYEKTGNYSPSEANLFYCEVTVSAILEISERETYIGNKFYSSPTLSFIWGEGSFAKNGLELNNTRVFIDTKNASDAKVEQILQQIKSAFPQSKFFSQDDSETEKEALLNSIWFSVLCLEVFIGAICLFIYINIIRNKYLNQKRLWGVIRALGVKKSTVILLHILETVLIFGVAAILNTCTIKLLGILPIRRDILFISPILILTYILFIITAIIGTLPTVISLFNEKIIRQIEYIN